MEKEKDLDEIPSLMCHWRFGHHDSKLPSSMRVDAYRVTEISQFSLLCGGLMQIEQAGVFSNETICFVLVLSCLRTFL